MTATTDREDPIEARAARDEVIAARGLATPPTAPPREILTRPALGEAIMAFVRATTREDSERAIQRLSAHDEAQRLALADAQSLARYWHSEFQSETELREANFANLQAEEAISAQLRDALAKAERQRDEALRLLATPEFVAAPDADYGQDVDDLQAWDDRPSPGRCWQAGWASRSVPAPWIAHVILSRDDDGDPDETEIRLFATEAEARAALGEGTS